MDELRRKIRNAILNASPASLAVTEVGDIIEAVMDVLRDEETAREVRISEEQQGRGSQVLDPWTDERYS